MSVGTSAELPDLTLFGEYDQGKVKLVIKRLHPNPKRYGDDEWPDVPDSARRRDLYCRRQPFRKMRVMIDLDVLDDGDFETDPTPSRLVTDLARHSLLFVLRYADNGPPPSVERDGNGLCKGWIVVNGYDPGFGWRVFNAPQPNRWSGSGVSRQEPDRAANDDRSKVYQDLQPEEARLRRRADALAAQVALEGVRADIYVTERPYLHAVSWEIASGVTICTVKEALSVLGLYFRAQAEYLITTYDTLDKGSYYWVGAREVLPAGWRWFSACIQHSSRTRQGTLFRLGGSVLQRVARALEVRDQVHLALNQPQRDDTHDSVLANLDVLLVLLMGAFDACARVAHRVLKMSDSSKRDAGWQKPGWIAQVQKMAPILAAVVDPGTPGAAVMTVLSRMRNSVHGATLRGLLIHSHRAPQTLVDLPNDDRESVRITTAMETLGGSALWGAATGHDDQLHFDPGAFADRLVDAATSLLDELMKFTPVEGLENVRLAVADCAPPVEPGGGFRASSRQSIRWQLGL